MDAPYQVHVFKDYLKFSAAHFIAYKGFREPLHGHNYQVSVRVEGGLGADGYVLDFGLVKQAAKRVCERLDERVILPEKSDCLRVTPASGQVVVTYDDGATFSFPESDAVLLPIVHSSIEVGVAEAPGQIAYCREEI